MMEPHNPITQSSSLSNFIFLNELYSFLQNKGQANYRGRRVSPEAFRGILSLAECIVAEGCYTIEGLPVCPLPVMLRSLHMCSVLVQVKPYITDEQHNLTYQMLSSLVSQNVTDPNGKTPLHLACSEIFKTEGQTISIRSSRFYSQELVEMLLEVGADPNARDKLGNTPLHLAASNQPCTPALVRVLLSHGAHFDIRNASRQTFRDLLSGKDEKSIYNPFHYTKLSCLAARVIIDNNIPFSHGQIPASLEEFVLQH